MFIEKAGNEWKRNQLKRKEGRRQLTNRESKRSSQAKRKRSSRELTRKTHIKLDLKTKLANQRGNTSRNVSIKKRGTYSKTNKSSMKCFLKKKSSEKGRKIGTLLAHSRRELKKEQQKHGLMGMLKEKVKRSQKSLSKLAQNYKSKIKADTPKTKEKSTSKYKSLNRSKDKKRKQSFKMKENRTNWQLKLKKKKYGPGKIEKVIKAFDERCKRIDKKLGGSRQKKSTEKKESKMRHKERLKQSLKGSQTRKVESRKEVGEQTKTKRSEIEEAMGRRVRKENKGSENSEYMLRPAKEKTSMENLGISKQSSKKQLSVRKTFKESTCSENDLTNLLSTNQKEKAVLQKSGKSTLGLWSSSIKNIHKQTHLNISKRIRSTTAKEKKAETKELKKFLSPERIKSYLLQEKRVREFGIENSQHLFTKYKRGGKVNLDKSHSRVLTGDKTPSSQKNRKGGDQWKSPGKKEVKWELRVWELEKLVEGLHEIGAVVGGANGKTHLQIRRNLARVEHFLNSFIGGFRN